MSDSKVFRKYDFEVHDIVDHSPKTVDRLHMNPKIAYLVRWKGLPPYADTWESLDDLACADKIAAHKIAAYYEKYNEKVILRSNARTRKQYENSLEATKKRKHTAANKNSS